EAKIISEAKI
ncbi:unnamed protein product, partial [Allacma fusca]